METTVHISMIDVKRKDLMSSFLEQMLKKKPRAILQKMLVQTLKQTFIYPVSVAIKIVSGCLTDTQSPTSKQTTVAEKS